ncbi:hypothetical protein HNY73_008167 [Argiope bruennichi]|uniref:Uncharacterized protein n=1 Tax=Argiope bruennichi TaxID=94029 RepID=A0A8T0F7T2_ARGBR|nr:hypothetical protein HNY73_008167 [Argiope bruennichi]
MDLDLLHDTKRLRNLSNFLNLEDNANKYKFSSASHILFLLEDYNNLQEYAKQQKIICSSYGIDGNSISNDILKKMRDLLFHFGAHEGTVYAFCDLKAEMCLEQEEFFDHIIYKVEERLNSSSDPEEQARLIKTCFKIRKMYQIFQQ